MIITGNHLRKFVLVASAVLLPGLTSNATVPMATTSRIGVSAAALSRYAQTHALSDLRSAILGLSGTINPYSLTPQNFSATRRSLVQAWAPVIKAIESAYEPGYDPVDTRTSQVSARLPRLRTRRCARKPWCNRTMKNVVTGTSTRTFTDWTISRWACLGCRFKR